MVLKIDIYIYSPISENVPTKVNFQALKFNDSITLGNC